MRFLLFLIALAMPASAISQVQAPKPAPPTIAATAPEIDRIFADFMLDNHLPGIAYGIVVEGRLVVARGLGVLDVRSRRPVTADSLFRIASMTKAFTALAILKLRDQGRLRLDDLAETYIPEMRGWQYPTADSPRITIRHLLTHSGGLVTDNPWGDRQQPLSEAEFTRMLQHGVPFSRVPGSAFEYSNFDFALLGRIVANVSGRSYREYVESEILRPLGMRSSGFEVTEWPIERRAIGYRWDEGRWVEEPTMRHGAFGAMGGLQTSVNDYGRYVAWLLSAWPARSDPETGPISRSSVRELRQGANFAYLRPRFGRTASTACRLAATYGMGMFAATDCDLGFTLYHGGGYPGYGSHILLLPDNGIGIFAFANGTYAGVSSPVWDVALLLRERNVLTARPIPVTPALLHAYAAVGRIYGLGNLAAERSMLSMNFFRDHSEQWWLTDLGRLRTQVGSCNTEVPIAASTALAGRFTWRCEHGRLSGFIQLAPTDPPTIQQLDLSMPTP